jgi:signal transduction histidine kinase
MTFIILRNVISNAIKFTERSGQIEVMTRDDGDYLQIIIKDTGIGIDKEKINNLFTLQEKKSSVGTEREKGSGLGLVLVNEFIQINNGNITVESSSSGTSFHIFLPGR